MSLGFLQHWWHQPVDLPHIAHDLTQPLPEVDAAISCTRLCLL
jgi:hypothetical protein